MRIQKAHRLEHHIEWHHHHNGRQDALRDYPEQDIAIAKRHFEVAAERARKKEEQRQRHRRRHPPGHAGIGGRQNDPDNQQHEDHDVAEFGPVLDPGERVRRHGPDSNTENGRDDADNHRIGEGEVDLADLRLHRRDRDHRRQDKSKAVMRQQIELAGDCSHIAIGIGGEIDPPGIQRRLEIHKRYIARTLIDRRRILEGCDDHPVNREQHEQRPDSKEAVDHDLGYRRHLADGRLLEHLFEQAAPLQVEFGVRDAHARVFLICPRTT